MNKEHVIASLDQDMNRSAWINVQSRKVFLRKGSFEEAFKWLQNNILHTDEVNNGVNGNKRMV